MRAQRSVTQRGPARAGCSPRDLSVLVAPTRASRGRVSVRAWAPDTSVTHRRQGCWRQGSWPGRDFGHPGKGATPPATLGGVELCLPPPGKVGEGKGDGGQGSVSSPASSGPGWGGETSGGHKSRLNFNHAEGPSRLMGRGRGGARAHGDRINNSCHAVPQQEHSGMARQPTCVPCLVPWLHPLQKGWRGRLTGGPLTPGHISH